MKKNVMPTLDPNQLTVAFIWHMHQPIYKNALSGEYLMPWVRLHAIKDYLDMVLMLKDFPKIQCTVNLVPSLIDQCLDYINPETHDPQSRITCQATFSDEDRLFILERCFDAPFHTKISTSNHYTQLFNRLQHLKKMDPNKQDWLNAFSDQELADITALFNLVWFDPMWFNNLPELARLWEKQSQYTVAERRQIIQIQRDIIAKLIPTYKELQKSGQIEVTTSPYYHPILPLLVDTNSAHIALPHDPLPHHHYKFTEDAEAQLSSGFARYKECFDVAPKGIWPSEQSISPKVLDLIKEAGFKWAVSSEGNLAKSLGLPKFEKDGLGNYLHPEMLCRPYQYNGTNMLFRHLVLSDLIGFQYYNMSAEQGAEDLYWRIKDVHHRCLAAGEKYPVLTIALDGENCWEQYEQDGIPFLNALYERLSNDESLKVSTVSDYFEAIEPEAIRTLSHLHSGSWINSDFHIWIGDPIKNAAWDLMYKTRQDLVYFEANDNYDEATLSRAWDELYIAEGSDWFWWYGEPNHSGQDELFDEQFRLHLANVYNVLKKEVPEYLYTPLHQSMGKSYCPPEGPLCKMGEGCWNNAGRYDLLHGAMHKATRVVKTLLYGSDSENIYFQLSLNDAALSSHHHKLVFYACTPGKTRYNSPMRLKLGSHPVQTQHYQYAYEFTIAQIGLDTAPTVRLAEATTNYLWQAKLESTAIATYDGETLIATIPFGMLGIQPGEHISFVFTTALEDVMDECHPSSDMLDVKRYHSAEVLEASTVDA